MVSRNLVKLYHRIWIWKSDENLITVLLIVTVCTVLFLRFTRQEICNFSFKTFKVRFSRFWKCLNVTWNSLEQPVTLTKKNKQQRQKYHTRDAEALRKRLSVKIRLWNGETVYLTFRKFSSCWSNLFNYTAIKLVAYTVCMCLNRSCTQCVCETYKRSNYHFNN